MEEAVVIFGKTARAGEVKTRMSPPLDPQLAAELYDAFARDVMETVRRFRDDCTDDGVSLRVVLAWKGEPDDELARHAREDLGFEVIEQPPGDLGDRLRGVFRALRADGVERMMAVGTDSPTLSPQHLHSARLELKRHDVVFGPCFDGGYYLVAADSTGGEKPQPEEVIFEEISWSSQQVLEQSWHRAQKGGLLCELLGFWYDLDTVEDLRRARFHLVDYFPSRDPHVGRYTRQKLKAFTSSVIFHPTDENRRE